MYSVNNLIFSEPNHLGPTCFLDFYNNYALHIAKIENEDLTHYYHITFMKSISYKTYSAELDENLNQFTSEIEKYIYSDNELQYYIDLISNIGKQKPLPTPVV